MPMKLLAISVRSDFGGGPEHLYRLMEAVGAQVDVCAALPNDIPYWQRIGNLSNVSSLVEIPHRSIGISHLRSLSKIIVERDIQLLHSHGKGAGIYARALSLLTGRPCVHTFHGLHVGEYGALQKQAYLCLERLMGVVTNSAISVSEGEAQKILASGIISRRKLHVIENGVIVPDLAPLRLPAGTHFDPLRVVAVSRSDVQKNAELLLPIAHILEKASKSGGPEVRITVLGTGDGLEDLRAKVAAEGLSWRLELIGPHSAPREVFRTSDVFLSTSRWEGMPLAVLEAMSEGLPVVATNVVGNRDVLRDGVGGLLYPSEDSAAGAKALLQLANPEVRNRLGAEARARVETRYSVTRMAKRTLEVYRDALA